MPEFPPLHKGRGRNAEPFAEREHLANVEFSLTRQDFGRDTLTADLAQVAWLQAVLFHQKFKRLHTRDLGQRVMFGFIVLDQIAHDVDKALRGMPYFLKT